MNPFAKHPRRRFRLMGVVVCAASIEFSIAENFAAALICVFWLLTIAAWSVAAVPDDPYDIDPWVFNGLERNPDGTLLAPDGTPFYGRLETGGSVRVVNPYECEHPDVRYSATEKGAIACYVCGRLFGHLDGRVFVAFNPATML